MRTSWQVGRRVRTMTEWPLPSEVTGRGYFSRSTRATTAQLSMPASFS
jgi:hypothetical protein